MPALAIAIVVFFLRRLRPTTVALLAYRTWRRLPPEQRQAMLSRRAATATSGVLARPTLAPAHEDPPALRAIRSCSC